MGRSVYYRQVFFSAFHRLFYRIVNLEDIDQKFSVSLSDISIDNPEKFREVNMPRSFWNFGLQITD